MSERRHVGAALSEQKQRAHITPCLAAFSLVNAPKAPAEHPSWTWLCHHSRTQILKLKPN